jgi:hypothetical protein
MKLKHFYTIIVGLLIYFWSFLFADPSGGGFKPYNLFSFFLNFLGIFIIIIGIIIIIINLIIYLSNSKKKKT